MLDEAFFDIESLKLDEQFLCVVFGEYRNYCLLFFDITLNFLEKNVYANLLSRCDDACVITPYLFIYNLPQNIFLLKFLSVGAILLPRAVCLITPQLPVA